MSQSTAGLSILSNQVALKDSANLDSFSRLRVSQPFCQFEATHAYGLSKYQFGYYNTGQGSTPVFNSSTRMVDLVVTSGGSGGTSITQSLNRFPYQPGKSYLSMFTFVLGSGVASAKKRVGIFDGTDGIYLEQDGTNGLNACIISGGSVTESAAQASWNLDAMNGSGASGVTIDVTKAQILVIDFQYLGMGRVRIGLDVNGSIIYFHQFLHANVVTQPFIKIACLPTRYEVSAGVALGSSATMSIKCVAVYSEGGFEASLGYSFGSGSVAQTVATSRTHVLSIRPKTTFSSAINRMNIRLDTIDILSGSNQVLWELMIGVTFSVAPTYADVNSTYSGTEIGTGGTFQDITTVPGLVIASGFIATGGAAGRFNSRQDVSDRIPICLDMNGANIAMGTLSLVMTSYTGTSACQSLINFTELR